MATVRGYSRAGIKLHLLWLLVVTSCVWHGRAEFRVVAGTPHDVLRYPDSHQAAFPDVLLTYNGFRLGGGSMCLRPGMDLRVENAYYQPGSSRQGLDGFLGTETARYRVRSGGRLQLSSVESMKNRPGGAVPVQELIQPTQSDYRYHRFYNEIFFRGAGESRGSVLLSADSMDELNHLSAQLLTSPESVCNSRSEHCSVFPEACSVSVEIEITVNGKPESVPWGAVLSSVAGHTSRIEMLRVSRGHLVPVRFDLRDSGAFELPLLPGDRVNWQ